MKPNHDFTAQAIAVNHCPELLRPSSAADQRDALLGEFAQGLCRDLVERLAPLLAGEIPSVKTQSPEILPAKALLRGEGEPQAHFRVDDEMLDLRMIASIYVAQAMSLTEYMFGGSGEGTAGEGIEQSIPHSAILVIEQVVAQFSEATRAFLDDAAGQSAADGRRISLVTHPLRNPPFPPAEFCLTWPITIAINGNTQWSFRLAVLECRLLELLAQSHAWGEGSRELANPIASLGHVPLRLAAKVAQFDLPLSRLVELAVGDILPIAPAREIPLQIDRQVLAYGQLGAIDERRALRLSRLS